VKDMCVCVSPVHMWTRFVTLVEGTASVAVLIEQVLWHYAFNARASGQC
jgi:hypothetical protein